MYESNPGQEYVAYIMFDVGDLWEYKFWSCCKGVPEPFFPRVLCNPSICHNIEWVSQLSKVYFTT